MINPKEVSYALIYVNTKEQFQRTGVVHAVIVAFRTDPETRMTLWHTKREDGVTEYQVPSFDISSAGKVHSLPCLYGKAVEELVQLAEQARGKLTEALREKNKKVQYGHIYKIQRGAVEDITDNAQ